MTAVAVNCGSHIFLRLATFSNFVLEVLLAPAPIVIPIGPSIRGVEQNALNHPIRFDDCNADGEPFLLLSETRFDYRRDV